MSHDWKPENFEKWVKSLNHSLETRFLFGGWDLGRKMRNNGKRGRSSNLHFPERIIVMCGGNYCAQDRTLLPFPPKSRWIIHSCSLRWQCFRINSDSKVHYEVVCASIKPARPPKVYSRISAINFPLFSPRIKGSFEEERESLISRRCVGYEMLQTQIARNNAPSAFTSEPESYEFG